MTTRPKSLLTTGLLPALLAIAILAFGAASPALAGNGNQGNPGVLPPQSNPHGKSYGDWAAAWWQWALSIPAALNPLEDTTGQHAGVGQSGPVWFIAGTFGDLPSPVVRTFTIPAGKALFLPVYNWIFGACAGDCGASNPGVTCDVPTLQASAAAAATSIQSMDVTIDDESVNNLRNYRAFSPGGFSITLPPANVLQALGLASDVAGTYAPQVADGYWLMLAPLPPGQHIIKVHLLPNPSFGVEQTIIYNFTVSRGAGRDENNAD